MSENLASVQASHQRPLEARDSAGLWVQRLSLAAGGLAAMGLVPNEAQAGIIYISNSPLSVNANTPSPDYSIVGWDVDNSGDPNFMLVGAYLTAVPFKGLAFSALTNNITGYGPGNQSVIVNGLAAKPLSPAATIQAVPVSGGNWTWAFGGWLVNNNFPGVINPPYALQGWQAGLNYFGFRFAAQNLGDYYYGWGEINVDPSNYTLTLTRWAYNDVANAPITVGDTGPEPVPGPLGLAGLAAGAAWSRKLRRRIRESA